MAALFNVPAAAVLTPMCPACGQAPAFVFPRQALCGDEECRSVMWDPLATVEELRASERAIRLERDDL